MQNYLEIFFIGLLGSMHCIGMCGGFVALYSLRKPVERPSLYYHLLYNLGRITTYSILGGVLGYIGSFLSYLGMLRGLPGAVLVLAGVLMILMGLNMAGILGKRGLFEDPAITETSLFRRSLRRVLALESMGGAFVLGLLLGLLPCGLVYTQFLNAAASGGFFPGMTVLAVFGLGTVPGLFAFGLMVTTIPTRRKLLLYRVAAFLIVVLGLQAVLRGMSFNGWISPGRFW